MSNMESPSFNLRVRDTVDDGMTATIQSWSLMLCESPTDTLDDVFDAMSDANVSPAEPQVVGEWPDLHVFLFLLCVFGLVVNRPWFSRPQLPTNYLPSPNLSSANRHASQALALSVGARGFWLEKLLTTRPMPATFWAKKPKRTSKAGSPARCDVRCIIIITIPLFTKSQYDTDSLLRLQSLDPTAPNLQQPLHCSPRARNDGGLG